MTQNAPDQAQVSAVITETSQTLALLQKTLTELAPLLAAIQTIAPYIELGLSLKKKTEDALEVLASLLRSDLSETPTQQEAIAQYILDMEKYNKATTEWLEESNKVLKIGGNGMTAYRPTAPILKGEPPHPGRTAVTTAQQQQDNFILLALGIGILGAPAIKYNTEQALEKKIENPLARAAAADVVAVGTTSAITALLGKMWIQQSIPEGAYVGFKVAATVIIMYEMARGVVLAGKAAKDYFFPPSPPPPPPGNNNGKLPS